MSGHEHPNIVLGVSSSISAYKAPSVVSGLRKRGYDVRVVMTQNALRLITDVPFAMASGHPVVTSLWDYKEEAEHIELAKWANAFVVCPATANIIAKLAVGIADDALSTAHLAFYDVPIIVCPAMNTNMFKHVTVATNLFTLQERGYKIMSPAFGRLACGDEGEGKLPDTRTIVDYVDKAILDYYPKMETMK